MQTGASLESLAKGAVPFSQRFTVRELQDRWYSLLYDPGVSTSASACMIEYERSASNLPSKFNRFGISKENKSANAKRKAENIRTCYYALRKRSCSEPFESMDLSFLVAPSNNNYVGNGDEPLSGTCVLGDPISHSFGLEGSKMDSMHHTFAENLMHDGDAAIHFFNSVTVNPDEGFPYDPNNVQDEMPHIFEDNLPLMGNGSEVEELGHQNRLQECSLFKTDDAFGQINNNQQNISSEFEEKKVFSSPISECGGSFNNVDFSSPLPGLSIWRTVSAPELPVDLSAQENNLSAIGTFELPEDYDAKNTGTSGYDIQSDVKVKNELSLDDFRIDTSTEGYFAELSNSLLNFSNEEELMCIDGKDTIDESYYDGLSSLLLSSPNDNSHDQMINLVEQETSVAPDMCIANSSVPCLREPEVNQGSKGDKKRTCNLENPMQSSVSASDFQFSELKDGVICCTLNTEDSEVPYNDDVFLTDNLPQALMSSVTEQRVWEANNQGTLFRNSSINKKINDIGTSLMHKKQKSPRELYLSYQIIQSHVSQEMDLNCGVKIKHSATDSPHLASNLAAVAVADPDEMSTVQVSTKASLPEMLHGKSKPSQHLNSNDYSVKKSAFESEGHKNYPPVSNGIKEEHGVSEVTRDHQASCAQISMEIAVSETVLQPQSPEWEADLIESDHEVPCYSDIEAMVRLQANILIFKVYSAPPSLQLFQ